MLLAAVFGNRGGLGDDCSAALSERHIPDSIVCNFRLRGGEAPFSSWLVDDKLALRVYRYPPLLISASWLLDELILLLVFVSVSQYDGNCASELDARFNA